jgi:acetyltransferase
MLGELRIAPLLGAFRGRPAVDRVRVAEVVSRFSRLAVDVPEFAEIELNPLIAGPEGAIAVDARATFRRPASA